jgi:cell division protein FtsN
VHEPYVAKKPVRSKPSDSGKGSFPVWVVVVLLLVGALGAGAYYLYPKLSVLYSKWQTVQTEPKPVISEQPVPEKTVAQQSTDPATDPKNALNPQTDTNSEGTETLPVTQQEPPQQEPLQQEQTQQEQTQQPVAQPVQSSPPPQQTTATKSIGNGRYVVVVGSFSSVRRAENYGKLVGSTGSNYEVINFGNGKVRVVVADYNSLEEARNNLSAIQATPYCQGAWILRR